MVDCTACDDTHDIHFDCMKEVLMSTVSTRPCDKRVLASWVREDGFPGLASLIQSTPPGLLPSVLRWTARHIHRHPVFDDEEARVLPDILWAEAQARDGMPAVRRFHDVAIGLVILSLILLEAHLEYLWA